jgi:putative ABC transport system ATP-binding protein
MKDTILRTDKLCKKYENDGQKIEVLNSIDLEIYNGDFTVIMGQSGSGKSTLLYCLSGMDNVTKGRVFYKNMELTKIKEKDIVKLRNDEFGFIFQQMHLINNLTVFENIAICGYINRSAKKVDKDTNDLLRKISMDGKKKFYPSQISGGQAQRVAIARALINNPTIIFADEPTGALNRKNANDVLNILSELNEEGQSILMVTHDLNTAIRANRIIYLEDGKIKGKLNLEKYKTDDIKEREERVNNWLADLLW